MDWSYVSGYWDADGSCYVRKKGNILISQITFNCTDREPMLAIHEFLKTHGIGLNIKIHRQNRGKNKPMNSLQISAHKEVVRMGIGILQRSTNPRKKENLVELLDEISRHKWRTEHNPTPEQLHKLYWDDGLPAWMIGEKFDLSETHILRLMKKANIPRRTRSEAISLRYKKKREE